ncbi:hypothetical protein [Nocardia violaceofusca]|uniref:hypothetical protein n=1 Tax=Nocardia violaceofusca TaxID=941182 RepID=UPI0012F4BDCE|nr:hypothetical protein [Nocardia violaceofusca]
MDLIDGPRHGMNEWRDGQVDETPCPTARVPRIDSRFIRERRGFESLGVTPVAEVLVADGVTSAAVSPNHRGDPATDEVLG